jgi:hypothetical protein
MNRRRRTWILTAVLTLAPAAAATACPMCKDSVKENTGVVIGDPGEGGGGGGLPSGFNTNVYYMLSALGIVLGGVLGMIVRQVRGADVRNGNVVATRNAPAFPVTVKK